MPPSRRCLSRTAKATAVALFCMALLAEAFSLLARMDQNMRQPPDPSDRHETSASQPKNSSATSFTPYTKETDLDVLSKLYKAHDAVLKRRDMNHDAFNEYSNDNDEEEDPIKKQWRTLNFKLVLEPFKHNESFASTPRITYMNGHRGCNENMHGVLSSMRLNFKVMDPRRLIRYGMSRMEATKLIKAGFIKKLCDASDVIIIADTAPDARALLLSLLDKNPKKRCKSNIVVELTNRYDWMVRDRKYYNSMFSQLFANPPKNLFWVANNPFEPVFMNMEVGSVPPKIRLLRALGNVNAHSFLDSRLGNDTTAGKEYFLSIIQDLEDTGKPKIGDVLSYLCMPVATLPKKYGGPTELLRYKGFIEFPYQVSVMKFYENIANGVPQLLPTPRFLKQIAAAGHHHYIIKWLESLEDAALFLKNATAFSILQKERKQLEQVKARGGAKNRISEKMHQQFQPEFLSFSDALFDWVELMDFYRAEFAPFVYFFDSFEDLGRMINTAPEAFDYKRVRENGPVFYAKIRQESLDGWKALFDEMANSAK
ncbi:hypothetical protein CcCBS67573_g04807 [Chytriomyces confervae]|uniref:Uncharacterized protein n=1 Tax=Chytriomyces confervae TaxID=246404 RepID=A0A507FCB4_9FUNG|nr:hypothetical protein CcCBS67573_g04807 [Chytriomyces confervae]